jgi:MFS family permease
LTAAHPETPRFAALQHRNFALIWSGLIVSNVGTWMQNVAQGWLVLQLTNSPLWLGFLGLSFAAPMIVLPFVGGVVVDRIHRIRLLYVTQTGLMLIAFALAALTWLNLINVWHILAASFLGAILLAFDNPARQALLPDLVPERDLLNAVSLNSATYNGAALIGPAIAGALLGRLGAGWLFFLNGVSYLAVLFALLALRNVRTHGGGQHSSLRESALAGLAYAWRERFILMLLLLSALAAIFGRSYQNLLPIFARDIWKHGAEGYGFLLSAAGGGALLGAFGLAFVRRIGRHGIILVSSGLVFSAMIILFAVSRSLLMGCIFLFLSGVAATVFGTIIATFIQVRVPNELRGRIMSLYTITLIGLPSLGALGSGAVAQALGGVSGAPRAVAIGGVIVGVILAVAAPSFWRRVLNRPDHPAATSTPVGNEPRG